jgi:hypothetical protein
LLRRAFYWSDTLSSSTKLDFSKKFSKIMRLKSMKYRKQSI